MDGRAAWAIDMCPFEPHQRGMRWYLIILMWLWAPGALADPVSGQCSGTKWGQAQCIRPAHFVYDTCNAIDIFARRHGLNRDFFARLIWQESRFDPNALSPANARGIAQFIPSTAKLRGLNDPYNPADALEHSAQYLAEMVKRFGNEGMATIGYNGGERRATGFLQGKGLARETVNYVPIITGLSAETWRDAPPANHDMRLSKTLDFLPACYEMARKRRLSRLAPPPGRFKPWGVQLAFGMTRKQAQSAFAQRTTACRAQVRREKTDYVKVKHRASRQAGYVMARIGRNTRANADRLCAQLRRRGCVCAVYRNPP